MLETVESSECELSKTSEHDPESVKEPRNHFFYMRTSEEDPNSKYAVLFNSNVLAPGMDPIAVAHQLQTAVLKIPGVRPVAQLGSPADTPQKRPSSILTPGGTRLERRKDYNAMLTFSDAPAPKEENLVPQLPNVQITDILVPPTNDDGRKVQEIVVTPELLALATLGQQEGIVRGKNGISDNASQMARKGINKKKASANNIAALASLKTTGMSLWEWLHLIMFFLLKKLAQDPNNLTLGTREANTSMMISEEALVRVVRGLGKLAYLRSEAIEDAPHFGKEIWYTIKAENIFLKFVFNARTNINPTRTERKCSNALVDVLVRASKKLSEQEKENANPLVAALVQKSNELLYGKPNLKRTLFSEEDAPALPAPRLVFFPPPKKIKEDEPEITSPKDEMTLTSI